MEPCRRLPGKRTFVPNVGSTQRAQDALVEAQVDAIGKLTGEVDKMLASLSEEIQAREPKRAPAKPR